MSNNYSTNEYPHSEYPYPQTNFWSDSQYTGFDSTFNQPEDGDSAYTAGQSWEGFDPDSFSLAGRQEQQQSPYAWDNPSLDQNNLYSNDTSAAQVQRPLDLHDRNAAPGYDPTSFNPSAASRGSRQPFSEPVQSGSDFPASPYTFENDATNEPPQQSNVIAPSALHYASLRGGNYEGQWGGTLSRESTPASRYLDHGSKHLLRALPPGKAVGNFLVTTVEDLASMGSTKQLSPFISIATAPQDATVSRTTLPAYTARKSRNEMMKFLANNSSFKANINKKLSKKLAKEASKGAVTKHEVTKRAASETVTETSSDDESSSDESDEEESMQPPIPAKRPTDSALEATKYDTIKTLWRVPYRSAPAEEIRKAIQDFWEIVQTIRDRWKSDIAAVKQAEDAKKVKEVPMLQERVASQRNMLTACLKAAVAQGHQDILENIGQHLQLMGTMAVFIQDRMKENAYSGPLIKAVLEFLTKCKSMTNGVLERAQINKLLQRLAKRGDDNVKALAKRITDNAVSATQKKRSDAGDASGSVNKVAKTAKAATNGDVKSASTVSGVKRARESEEAKQPLKKVAGEKPTIRAPGVPQASALSGKLPQAKASTDAKPNGTGAAQTIKKPIPKSTGSGLFASLKPAYAKPTPAGMPGQRPPITSQSSQTKSAPASQAKTGFSFADAMASLTKPKEPEPEPKRDESLPPETPEERSRRLRKQSRRHLHVAFKPESELVDVRFFEHDPDEELGHDTNQVRDVDDRKSEGQMFKLQHQLDPDAMDVDEDEEEQEELALEPEKEYMPPSEIDFDNIDPTTREQNFYPYGGGTQFAESEEKDLQQKRESEILLAVYTSRNDIPSTPKEAPEPAEAQAEEPKPLGEPTAARKKVAKWEEEQKARQAAQAAQPTPDISSILAKLNQSQSQPQAPMFAGHQPPQNQNQHLDLQSVLAKLNIPQQGQQPQQQQQQSWQGQNFYGQQQQQYPYQQPGQLFGTGFGFPQQQQQQQHPHQPQPSAQQGGAPDISALLASLQSQQPAHQQPQQMTMPNMTSLNPLQTQPQPQPQQQAQPGPIFENDERRRLREGGAPAPDLGTQQDGKIPPNYKTVVCKYWLEGKCLKGDQCTFKHEVE